MTIAHVIPFSNLLLRCSFQRSGGNASQWVIYFVGYRRRNRNISVNLGERITLAFKFPRKTSSTTTTREIEAHEFQIDASEKLIQGVKNTCPMTSLAKLGFELLAQTANFRGVILPYSGCFPIRGAVRQMNWARGKPSELASGGGSTKAPSRASGAHGRRRCPSVYTYGRVANSGAGQPSFGSECAASFD